MVAREPFRVFRWSRWGIVLSSLVMTGALLITAWLGYVGARSTFSTVARGQGTAITEAVSGRLRAINGPPSQEAVSEILASLQSTGLRYIAVYTRSRIEAGNSVFGSDKPLPLSNKRSLERIEGRMRLAIRVGPPRPPPPEGRRPRKRLEERAPPDRMSPPHDRPSRLRRPGPPPLVLEFEPGPAIELLARARTSLIINACVGIGILLFAILGFVWLKRLERDELLRGRERHLATLGEMSAVLAHEIHNPITALKGHAQLLAEAHEGDEKKKKKADRVVRQAVRLESLTNDLLEFVRTGAIKPTQVSPVSILRASVSDTQSERVKIESSHAPTSWRLDSMRMQQALSNLVRNAVQASAEGSIDTSVTERNGALVYEVRDHGAGISPSEIGRIFEPFHTTKTRGTGLGLAVVRRIVELHGGAIHADNHPDGGARFRIEIPEGK